MAIWGHSQPDEPCAEAWQMVPQRTLLRAPIIYNCSAILAHQIVHYLDLVANHGAVIAGPLDNGVVIDGFCLAIDLGCVTEVGVVLVIVCSKAINRALQVIRELNEVWYAEFVVGKAAVQRRYLTQHLIIVAAAI